MNIEEVRDYALSLYGVTEDQPFGDDILTFRVEGKIFVCLWLGGGKSSGGTANSGNLRAVCNISLTTVKGVDFSEGSTNRTSSARWRVYAR